MLQSNHCRRRAARLLLGPLLVTLFAAFLPAGCNGDRDGTPTPSETGGGTSSGGTSNEGGEPSETEAGICGCVAPSGGHASTDDGGAGGGHSDSGVSLDVSLDEDHATSVDVPITGGTVTATGADGTTYELIIPEDALLEPTTVTLTPIAEVSELTAEIGKSHLGVQFAPEGLVLYHPATLVITPGKDSEIPMGQQLFVQWQEDGKHVELAPPDPNSSEIRLAVLHFSGTAVYTKGLDAPLGPVRQAIAGDAEAKWKSALAEYVTRVRDGESLAGQDPFVQALTEGQFYQRFVDEVMNPRFDKAESSCAAGRVAIITALQLGQLLYFAGLIDPNSADPWTVKAYKLYPKVAEICMKEEYEICRDQHIVHKILPARISIQRQNAIFKGQPESNAEALDSYVKQCLQFELDFDSTVGVVSHSSKCSFALSQSVESRNLALALSGTIDDWTSGSLPFTGSAPIESNDYTAEATCASGKDCGKIINFRDEVSSILFVMSLTPQLTTDALKDIELVYRPSPDLGSTFQVEDTCSDPTWTSPPLSVNWWTSYVAVLNATNPLNETKGGYVVSKWAVTEGQEEIATKHASGAATLSESDYSFVDVFTLRHEAM